MASDTGVRGPRRILPLLGPAFVAAIAYVDPGNVAANVTAGARYGFLLVWVIVLANMMAVLVQYQSAKLGLVTGRTLPELIGQRLRRPARLAFWAQAEVVAAATDLAEVLGGAIALRLLFGLPLLLGGVIVGVVSMLLLLARDRRGQQHFESVIVALLRALVWQESPTPSRELALLCRTRADDRSRLEAEHSTVAVAGCAAFGATW